MFLQVFTKVLEIIIAIFAFALAIVGLIIYFFYWILKLLKGF